MTAAAKGSLLEAVLAVQDAAPVITKAEKASTGSYTYTYADLAGVIAAIKPHMTEHKLVFMAFPSYDANTGEPTLKYRLAHVPSGEDERGEMKLMLAKPDAQAQGSGITYARRYALVAALNLVTDDDDGQAASAPQASSYGRERTVEPRPATKPQITKLKGLRTKNRVSDHEMGVLMRAAGFVFRDGDTLEGSLPRLTVGQASALIDELSSGPVKTGESDVPGAEGGEFEHPVEPEDQTRLLEGSGPT